VTVHDPAVTEILQRAVRHCQAGRLAEARELLLTILTIEPGHADSFHFLGLIAYQGGDYDTAIESIGEAIRFREGNSSYHYNLGNALLARGRIDNAILCYERSLALDPRLADAHNNLGIALVQHGRIDDAIAHYERALIVSPGHVNAHSNLGVAFVQQGRIDDAVTHYERVLAINPDHVEAHNNLGVALVQQGRIDDAVTHYERALALQPNNADAHNNLGVALMRQGRMDDAEARHRRVLAINPHHPDAHNELGNICKVQGRFDDAMAHYAKAIAIRPACAEAHFSRAEIKKFHNGDADLAALEALAAGNDLSVTKAPLIHFALAKALEDTGNYTRAFEYLRKGNDLKRRQFSYDEPGIGELFRRIASVFDGSLFDRFQGEGDPSTVPIFVLGMPRSGSTLIEQILASHPQIHGAGELSDLEITARAILNAGSEPAPFAERVPALDGPTLRRIGQSYLAGLPALADGKVRIVDKMPGNFLNLGLIRLIFPNARIIHTMRDPVDTCLSCYSKLFASGQLFSYELGELGRLYRRYRDLMAHWRSVVPPGAILDVSYEDVVDDLEGQARRLIAYCGLPWDDRCLSFHRNSRPVKTASTVQVRQPLFRSSLQRWRKYEAGLAPLLRELGEIVPQKISIPDILSIQTTNQMAIAATIR
jgi:tetratricopeptide (TPR) repeat protein